MVPQSVNWLLGTLGCYLLADFLCYHQEKSAFRNSKPTEHFIGEKWVQKVLNIITYLDFQWKIRVFRPLNHSNLTIFGQVMKNNVNRKIFAPLEIILPFGAT